MSLKKAHSVTDTIEFTHDDITDPVIEQDKQSASITQNKGDSDVIVNTSLVKSLCIYKVQSDKNKSKRLIKKSTNK